MTSPRPGGASVQAALRRTFAFGAVALLVTLMLLPGWASATAVSGGVATWTVKSIDGVDGRYKGQGLATVLQPDGTTKRYFTGDSAVPQFMKDAGWNHNGDPDSAEGYIFEAYQSSNGGAAQKLFHVTAPDGTMTDFIHQDMPGELMNNSFAAVTPDAQWMVSGEWESMHRLLIMPTPILNPTAPGPAADLPVTGQILLDKTVVNIQGCTFQTGTRLFCTSDDPVTENGIPRKSLLQVDLAHPIDGGDVAGAVSVVFALPVPISKCPIESPGSWPTDIEIEGIDYDRWSGVLAVLILPPRWCALNSRVYNYTSPQATATHIDVVAPATATIGVPVTATLTARDAAGASVPGYTGSVTLSSSDPAAALPATATFAKGHASVTVTFRTAGSATISATDPVLPSIAGTSAATLVAAPPPPSTTVSTTTTSTATTARTAAPGGAGASVPSPRAGAPSAVTSGALPATGRDVRVPVSVALVLIGAGVALVRTSRSRLRRR